MSVEKNKQEVIHTKIWREEPEPDNPFAAKKCFCAGFNVYEDLLGNASWAEYLYLLFKLEKPTKEQAELLETIAVAIANPGIRDHSVRAAMNAGVGGSSSASALMAALAVGAGQYGGAREVYLVIELWQKTGCDIQSWGKELTNPESNDRADVWLPMEHPPGFDPNGSNCPTTTLQLLDKLTAVARNDSNLHWLNQNRIELEKITQLPLSLTFVIATALVDLTFSAEQGEMIFLLLRLPGAATHALEQRKLGWKKYPFFINGLSLLNDPGPVKK